MDCVVIGEICVDIPLGVIDRELPLKEIEYLSINPITPNAGGIIPNCGAVMERYGLDVMAMGCIGDDLWGRFLTEQCRQRGINTTHLITDPDLSTSAAAILVSDDGEHTFFYHSGASRSLDKSILLKYMDLFCESTYALVGYYALLPQLEPDLPEVLQLIQENGCKTAMDAAGGGGSLEPLTDCLPYLDIYIPSYLEGLAQTGKHDPREMISTYREYCPHGLLGIKLGAQGALLSQETGHWLEVPACDPPGPVVDTTGAGDSFYAGLITGFCRELELENAARLASASGACCVTEIGPTAGMRDYQETLSLAGLQS